MRFSHSFPNASSTRPRGCDLPGVPFDVSSWDGWQPMDWINTEPSPPAGWFSVYHWLALTSPHSFLFFYEPALETCLEEQAAAEKAAQREGFLPAYWPATEKMREAGINTVRLFPDCILRDIFGAR